jgi:hypothetical protein
MNGFTDFIKAFTIIGSIISVKALIDSQRKKPTSKIPSNIENNTHVLRRIEHGLRRKGIID